MDRGETASGVFASEGVPYVPLMTYNDLKISSGPCNSA